MNNKQRKMAEKITKKFNKPFETVFNDARKKIVKRRRQRELDKNKLKVPEFLQKTANRLNKNLPKSEKWFHCNYKYKLPDDKSNTPLYGKYIPDIVNFRYKYVVEVDGSIHKTPKQMEKDELKNIFYISKGFKVFRVIPYITDELEKLKNEIFFYVSNRVETQINNFLKPIHKKNPKTILRKTQT